MGNWHGHVLLQEGASMIWTIYSGTDLIYNPTIINDVAEREYDVIEPVLSESTGGFNTLTFQAHDGSPAVTHMRHLNPHVKLYRDGNLYMIGRMLSDTPDIYGTHTYYVEDFLGVLCDSVMRPYEFIGTPSEFLNMIIDNHNQQVNAFQRFSAVVCDVQAPAGTGNIVRSSESYASSWSVIKEKLIDELGGYMWMSYEDEEERPVLHYSTSARDTSTQTIELGENLASISIKTDSDTFYTACLPLGAEDEATKKPLTIADVNGGSDILVNTASAALYGVIFAPVDETTWEDVTQASNLLTRAQNWLQTKSAQNVQEIELDAVDLGDNDTESFMWLDAVRVVAPTRGLDSLFVIDKIERTLNSPDAVSITLNYEGRVITSAASAITNDKAIKEIKADYTTDGEARAIADEQIATSTAIEQKANAIILSALEKYTKTSDFSQFKSSVLSQLTLLAGQININFTSTVNQITTLSGQTTSRFEAISSFIRFLAYIQGQQNEGIVIGLSTSDIKLKLEHDILYFFTGDEKLVTTANAIAWFSANQLYVNNSTIQNLTLGTQGAYVDARIVGSGDNLCVLWSGRM